jgi:hypothetical protein
MEEQTRIKITPDIMKSQKTLTCSCGGMIFVGAIVFKKLSPLISPTGEEELYPIEVLICQKCGKVPEEFNNKKILPDEVLAKKLTIVK